MDVERKGDWVNLEPGQLCLLKVWTLALLVRRVEEGHARPQVLFRLCCFHSSGSPGVVLLPTAALPGPSFTFQGPCRWVCPRMS